MADICQTCRERPATVHLCEIVDGRQTRVDLCEACFRTHPSSRIVDLPSLDGSQKCFYCGAPAQCAGMNQLWEQEIRKQAFHYTCFRCAQLQSELLMKAIDAMPKGLSENEEMEAIRKATVETDRRVREQAKGNES